MPELPRPFAALLALTAVACGQSHAATDAAADAATTDSGARDSAATDSAAADSGPDAAPVRCGGFAEGGCGPGAYCDYPYDACGGDDGTGVCRPRPRGCPDVESPVCACDGAVYSNECEAQAAGVDVNGFGGCAPPPGAFPCGYRFCDVGAICRVTLDDTGMPPHYGCVVPPAGCPPSGPSCACAAELPCGELCEEDAEGHVTITCPGG